VEAHETTINEKNLVSQWVARIKCNAMKRYEMACDT
jgi:hypothetical protein